MSLKSKVTGLILAGGRGTRMGRVDKGLQPFRGATLVAHVLARLAPQVASLAVNANRNLPQYQAVAGALPVLPDYLDGFAGPLAGLQVGLQFCPTELLLTAPCDSPFFPLDMGERLYAAMQAEGADLAMAVTMERDPEQPDAPPFRQPHPVFSLVKASVLPQLEAYLETGARRMEGFYKSLRVAEVLFDDSAAFGNINTLEDLHHHERATLAPAPAVAQGDTAKASAATLPSAGLAAAAGLAATAGLDAAPAPQPPAAAASARTPDGDPAALPVDEAQRLICGRITPVEATEKLALLDALGRVLAEDIISPINVPAYDNSAMDGYALRGQDLPAAGATATFKTIGIAYAGHPFTQAPQAHECVRIMTGAAIPPGCDSVLPQELAASINGDEVTIAHNAIRTGANLRRAGEDLRAGGVAIAKSKLLRPADLGLIASLGISEVTVRRKLKVAFFSTGDELRSLGEKLEEGCVYDSNRYTLFGMLQRLGCEVIDLGVVRDDPQALEAALREASSKADAIITSGGVSEGAADYTRDIMALIGDVAFWKLAMRPGRPLAFGKVQTEQDSAWLFGLPGNPVAVMVSFYMFARPALLRMMGSDSTLQTMRARATDAIRKRPGRTEFQRGIVSQSEDGMPQVRLTGAQGSGILSSMTEANCIVVLHHDQASVAAGQLVDVMLFDGLV
ncbi:MULTISPECIES: gephyrin-like molybdotransferase Glp [unclassified Duganella]|uniref:molybdopterin molybdotransferase MoeA n=1 Tax=unclassified Duganella TaxID=2636909 RepID=UPI0008818ADB|nr:MULTISPECIES: gephyrin-like molybdotransferase Glp [unclassified Duganella]SDG01388.1 molybdenum cofactor guanylyltransferase [Duganella sp. OV458]SDJ03756.1 molybdopterin molybdotransferase [Duganella sp. OV510]